MSIRQVKNKLAKTEALLANPRLKQLVPATLPFSGQALKEMLGQYGLVYVKPVIGTFGKGVIRVEHRPNEKEPYRFQTGVRKACFSDFETMFAHLCKARSKRPCLIQQGIEMLRYGKRLFDLRLMVQKNPKGQWESTGLIGRLAHPRKIVTNYHNGGTPMAPEILFSPHMSRAEFEAFRKKLDSIGLAVAAVMEKRFPGIKELGVDIAVDGQRNPWILEVNTKPDPYIFRKLKDRSIFRKIYRYCVAYGRIRPRRRRQTGRVRPIRLGRKTGTRRRAAG